MIGKKIKELRLQQGLTQGDLEKKLNISQKTISKYELELVDVSTDILLKLSQIFNVSTDYLLGVEDDFKISSTPTPVVSRLTEKEERLLDAFKNLTELEQDKLIDDAEFYANRRGASTFTAIKK